MTYFSVISGNLDQAEISGLENSQTAHNKLGLIMEKIGHSIKHLRLAWGNLYCNDKTTMSFPDESGYMIEVHATAD